MKKKHKKEIRVEMPQKAPNLQLVKDDDKPLLRVVKVQDLMLIPKYLLDQVEDVYWKPEELYGLWPAMEGNVGNLLFALVDEENMIKGVMWLTISLLGRFLFLNVLSLDPKYKGKQVPEKIVMPYLKMLQKKVGLDRVIAVTARPKAYTRKGWKVAKFVIEMNQTED